MLSLSCGDIILLPFPFTDLSNVKVRPAVFVTYTEDVFKDIVICAISSVIPEVLTNNELLIIPSPINNLRSKSIIKIDRIATIKQNHIIQKLGNLNITELINFKNIFQSLVN